MRRCVDENEATGLLRGGFDHDDAEREAIVAHCEECAECFDLMSLLALVHAPDRRSDEPTLRLGRGAKLGRYVLLELVGVGGMGVVYAAHDPELDRRVALKLILSERGPAAEAVIVQEARAMAQLRHPNVVTVHELGTFDSGVFLAMELMVGTTLAAWTRRERRSSAQILSAFVAAGRGLEAAHRAGIVHRDFKPDNVLVEEPIEGDRRIAVTDFGLATARGTDAGVVAGTPHYMAPEQRDGLAPSDARADQYAFCVALRDALVGAQRSRRSPSKLRSIPGVSPRVARAIARGLAVSPNDRWPSMTALLAELTRPDRFLRAAAIAIASVLVIGLTFRVRIEQRIECERRTRAIDRLWNVTDKEAVRQGIFAVATSFAKDEWTRVERIVDHYVANTRTASVALCRSQPTPEAFRLQTECLDESTEKLRAFIELFKKPDAAMVRTATASAYHLGHPERCSDISALIRRAPSEAAPDTRHQLATARLLMSTGKSADARKLTEQAANSAEARGDRRSAAAAFELWSHILTSTGDLPAAEQRARRAETLAESVGADRTRAKALLSLMTIAGGHHLDLKRTLELDERLRLVLERVGGDDTIESDRLSILAMTYSYVGNDEAALPLNLRSVELIAGAYGRRSTGVAGALTNLGMSAFGIGDLRLARESFVESISIFTETQGPDFFGLTAPIVNLGDVDTEEDRFDEALASYERALSIVESQRGGQHFWVAATLQSIGTLEMRRGRSRDAVPILQRALSIVELTYGREHSKTQETLQLLGLAYFSVGDRDRAIDALSRAEERDEISPPELRARAKFALARALWASKKPDRRQRSFALAGEALELAKRTKRTKRRSSDLEKEKEEMAAWIARHAKQGSR